MMAQGFSPPRPDFPRLGDISSPSAVSPGQGGCVRRRRKV
ncbi:hypothetical protein SLNHY_6509 [Streptomyces albus]|nr:hypothetical protein SLNHY_6509 [Streptomyces albus]